MTIVAAVRCLSSRPGRAHLKDDVLEEVFCLLADPHRLVHPCQPIHGRPRLFDDAIDCLVVSLEPDVGDPRGDLTAEIEPPGERDGLLDGEGASNSTRSVLDRFDGKGATSYWDGGSDLL
ncbi:MAG: hypothetical protein O7H41_13330 [Planctomycetota bacterium]|nr:hypothetical protein [Planctomycetota bacterium]